MRSGEALAQAATRLRNEGVESPRLDAELLLAHVLGANRAALLARPDQRLTPKELTRYRDLVARRSDREPLAYITGHREFYDQDLVLDRRVLIPRPETELLVEHALRIVRDRVASTLHIADVGAGSGAIAVTLAVHLPRATIYALDDSAGALSVVAENADRCGVADRVICLQGDLLAPLLAPGPVDQQQPGPVDQLVPGPVDQLVPGPMDQQQLGPVDQLVPGPMDQQQPGPVDLITANLPYVSTAEWLALAPEIRDHEPRSALDGGPEGLDLIRRLLETAGPHLRPGGAILLEIGASQGAAVTTLAREHYPQAAVQLYQDYAGLDRLVIVETGYL